MKIDLNKFFKKSEAVFFPKEKKGEVRFKLENLIKETPIVVQEVTSARNESKWFVYLYRHTMTVSTLLIFFLVGSSSILAEGALPGDFLYSVKTNINEQVRGLFVSNAQEKALWNLVLAERRLTEFSKLSSENRLFPEQKEVLKKGIKNHTDKATEDFPLKETDFDDVGVNETKKEFLQEATEGLMPLPLKLESRVAKEGSGNEKTEPESSENIQKRIKESEMKIKSIVSTLDDISNTETARAINIKALIIKAQESLYEVSFDLEDGKNNLSSLKNAEELIRNAEKIIANTPRISDSLEKNELQASTVNRSIENLMQEDRHGRVQEDQEREED